MSTILSRAYLDVFAAETFLIGLVFGDISQIYISVLNIVLWDILIYTLSFVLFRIKLLFIFAALY